MSARPTNDDEVSKEKTERISMFDPDQLLKVEYYTLKSLHDNEFNFTMVMNVPMDGWCLLYAIQSALLIDYRRNVDLLTIRSTLIHMLETFVKREPDFGV